MMSTTSDPTATDDLFLLIDVAAARAGVSRRSIYNWIAAGEIETRRSLGGSRLVRFGDVSFKARRMPGRAVQTHATHVG